MPKFIPRERKHKVLLRQKDKRDPSQASDHGDSNEVEILSATQVEREKKKSELKSAIKTEKPQMSGKKKKRLDKYIVNCSLVTFNRTFANRCS